MVLQIYLDPCTINCRKVLAGLDLIGTKYDLHHIDYFKGEQKSEAFVKINPCATVPAATDGDLVITESNAIMMYAADADGGHSAYPKDLKARADANRWLLWEASVWFQTNYIYLVEYVVKPLLGAQPDDALIQQEAPKYEKAAAILDARLGRTGKWVLPGSDPTIVDMAIGAPMHLHAASRLPLSPHKNITRWLEDLEALPCWQKTQGAVDKALLPNGAPKEVRAEFNYTKDMGTSKLTELYFYEDPASLNIHEPGDDPQVMSVANGWDRAKQFSIDREGFAVKDFPSSFDHNTQGHWEDEGIMKEKFYPEVVSFLKKELGCSRVLVFDHTIRTQKNEGKKLTQETNTSQRAPVRLVHCDYTAESGPTRVQQLLPSEAPALLARRVAFINVWKPLNKVEENPLAMCDVTSSPPEDFFKLYLRYRDRTGENYVMRHSSRHQWWYFPDMLPEQAILLKTYDSDEGKARFVGHSAFTDPLSRRDAPFRESCEIRTICFF
ncbi:glutathione S-transferase GSTF2 [Lecanosticta acicola]|uniref:Glutathione S-transferase GSTF2 n=1 Tax=Lecanosticta acicola TaxID=111012 RepID=A0AAI8YRM7_9PEZI|nr:glutathione S-transferase GSTF2 [Lecanosticta acicola]